MPTWIHLSDLHLCAQKTGWDADRILKFLLDDLRLMERDHGLSPDLLLVSGDLAFGHLGDGGLSIQAQFEEVARFLRDVRNAFKRPIPSDRVFLVPGNHDVVRQKVLDSQTKYLDSLASDDPSKSINAINQLLRDASGEWPPLMQRLDAYREFLREHYPHLLQDEKRLCYAILLEIDGTRLGIGGISSAWSCGRDQEKGKLWLGGKWQFSTLRGKLDDADVRLALAHHPLTWLVPQENPALDPELEHSFHFFLHGHEHQAWVDEKQGHVRIAAGACYGESPRESGYSLVRLNRSEGKGEVWLRRFSDEGIGWIPRAIPGRTNNDGMWSLDIAHLRTTTTQPAGNLQEPPTADANRLLEVSTTIAPTSYGVFGDPAESRQSPGQPSNSSGGLAGTEDLVEAHLSGELQEALMAFSSQPKIWIEPTLCTCAEIERDCPTRRHVSASDFVVSVRSTIIKAPPQFGLTCLARHLVLQAWRLKVPSRWVYLDARSLTSSRTNVQKVASAELAHTGHRIEDAKCIVLDSLQSNEKAQLKILKTVCDVVTVHGRRLI